MILETNPGYYLIMIGFGFASGLLAILMSIVWLRYYGGQHLRAISGKAMWMLVMANAAGPYLFNLSFNLTNDYGVISYLAIPFDRFSCN